MPTPSKRSLWAVCAAFPSLFFTCHAIGLYRPRPGRLGPPGSIHLPLEGSDHLANLANSSLSEAVDSLRHPTTISQTGAARTSSWDPHSSAAAIPTPSKQPSAAAQRPSPVVAVPSRANQTSSETGAALMPWIEDPPSLPLSRYPPSSSAGLPNERDDFTDNFPDPPDMPTLLASCRLPQTNATHSTTSTANITATTTRTAGLDNPCQRDCLGHNTG